VVIRSFLSFKKKRRNLIFMAVNKPLIFFPDISVGSNNFDVYINILKAKVNLSSILYFSSSFTENTVVSVAKTNCLFLYKGIIAVC